MKTKNIIICGISMLILSVAATSCKKSFVELTPKGIIPVNTFYNTEIDIRSALTGAYSSLRPI
ncbi:hypothetical protein GJU39_06145 [Pedobacter petrophilus]|uniref:RagB/SusD family nutrient uptake outer membrane protein n=1 Tax=Pedobacter petrophilus TaxID=1908241 RepID=A0A7K0FY76_9SPHI|nr:hypothetical protein [Pedobacter petrophilus]MRX75666.1 hypothetical protein [Pedobacter petrophilus]